MSGDAEYGDDQVIEAWQANAEPWTRAVRNRTIESRKLVTDAAIIDAVLARNPGTVLDLGCGEGWLTRALSERGIRAVGVDAIPSLIDKAVSRGGGDFRVASYEDLAANGLDVEVDVVVANFSLIGGEAVDAVIRRVPEFLNPGGFFIVQTPHPVVEAYDIPYRDGWYEGSWAGCPDGFSKAAPWYFRTLGTWVRTLTDAGLSINEMREPIHPVTGKPASLILVGQRD